MLRVKNFIVSEESLVLKFSLEFGQTFILSVDIRLCLFHDFLYINSFPAKDFFLWFQTFPSFRLREDVLKRFCERWTNLLETHLVETIYCLFQSPELIFAHVFLLKFVHSGHNLKLSLGWLGLFLSALLFLVKQELF